MSKTLAPFAAVAACFAVAGAGAESITVEPGAKVTKLLTGRPAR